MALINVTDQEWEEAEAYFSNPENDGQVKLQRKNTTAGKKQGHSFVKINGVIYALNNTHHLVHEPNAGVGGFAKAKRGMNKQGKMIVLKVEGKEKKERAMAPEEAKKVDTLMETTGYMLGRVERPVQEGESGFVKAAEQYQTNTKVLTAFEYRGDRDLYEEAAKTAEGFTPPRNYVLALKAMMGISALHELNIIHKDIKQENFVLNGQGEQLTVMPIDFDMSEILPMGQDHIIKKKYGQPVIQGTPDFISPEIYSDGKYSFASDVYALGQMLEEMGVSPEITQKMKEANPERRIPLKDAMNLVVAELRKPEYADKPEVQKVLRDYSSQPSILATLKTSAATDHMNYAKSLSKEDLLEYVKKVMNAAAKNEKNEPKKGGVANIFRGSGNGDFFVAVTQLLLKKYGFPSVELLESISTQMTEINQKFKEYQASGEARKQAIEEARNDKTLTEGTADFNNFVENRARGISELKLHDLSKPLKEQIVGEFQLKVSPILSVFDPIREAVGLTDKEQSDYAQVIFSAFCTLPVGDTKYVPAPGDEAVGIGDVKLTDGKTLFSQLFRMSVGKNADAEENKKIIEPLKALVNTPPEQRKPITPLEILTNPAYFETMAYSELRKYCGDPKNGVYLEENLDFVKFYHEYAQGKFESKTEDELRAIMDVFLNGEPRVGFEAAGKSEINIQTDLKDELQIALGVIEVTIDQGGKKIVTKLDPPKTIDKQKFKEGLEAPYTEVMGMLTPDENLKKVKLSELSAPKQPDRTDSRPNERQAAPPSSQKPKGRLRSFFTVAVPTFFTKGPKAAREAYNIARGTTTDQKKTSKPPKVAVVQQTVNFEAVQNQLADFKTKILNDLDKQAWAKVETFVKKQESAKKSMTPQKFFKALKREIDRFYETASLPKESVNRALVEAGLVTREDSNTQQEKVANAKLEKDLAQLRGELEATIYATAAIGGQPQGPSGELPDLNSYVGPPNAPLPMPGSRPNPSGTGGAVPEKIVIPTESILVESEPPIATSDTPPVAPVGRQPDRADSSDNTGDYADFSQVAEGRLSRLPESIDIPPGDPEPLPESSPSQAQEYTNFFKAVLGNAYEYAGKGEWKWNGEGEGPCGKYSPKLLPAQLKAFDAAFDKGDRIAMKQANEGDPKKWTFVPPEGVKLLPPPPPRMVNVLAATLNNSSVPAVVPPSKPDGVDLGPPYNTVSFSSAGRGTGFFQNRSSSQEDSPENSIKKELKDVLGSVQLEGPGLDEVIGAVKIGERFLNGTDINVPEVISGILDEINKVENKDPKLEEFEGKLKGFQERLDQVKAPESRSSNSF